MKKHLLICAVLFFSFPAFADSISVGELTVPGDAYSVLSYNKDYSDNIFEYSLSLNANMSDKDLGIESIVVKALEYDDNTFDIDYRPLDSYRLGHGLLVNDLSTDLWHPAINTNEQSALRTSFKSDLFNAEAFGTYSHLYGGQIDNIDLFGLKFGFEAVSDAKTDEASTFSRSATGAFVELPINDLIGLYSEAATSANGGVGALTGITFSKDMLMADFNVDVAAVSFNEKFVPGYFTAGYDINVLDTSSLEASDIRRYGQMVSVSSTVVGLFDIEMVNESYTDGGSANSWSVLIAPTDQMTISAFQKEFSFSDFRLIKGNAANMIGVSADYDLGFGVASAIFKKGISDGVDKAYETSYIKFGYNI
jgi:hypothetical protein